MARVTKKILANRTDSNTYRKTTSDWRVIANGTNEVYSTSRDLLVALTAGIDGDILLREVQTFTISA